MQAAPTAQPRGKTRWTDQWIGRTVADRYRLLSLLGEGGMGAVFLAEHVRLGTTLALKILHPHLTHETEVRARFEREALVLASFEHEHVVSVRDFGAIDADGGFYIAMEHAQGVSLRDYLEREGALPWVLACHIGAQVADALEDARQKGIVHRDLKPDNIIIDMPTEVRPPRVHILDFGVARLADLASLPSGDSLQDDLTKAGTVLGTPGYMAPEQASGNPVDHRADIYAVGAMLWEMLAGRQLWSGKHPFEVLSSQLSDAVPSLAEARPDKDRPGELDALIARMVSVEPTLRPQRAIDVVQTLRKLAFAGPSNGQAANRKWAKLAARVAPGLPILAAVVAAVMAAGIVSMVTAPDPEPRRPPGPAALLAEVSQLSARVQAFHVKSADFNAAVARLAALEPALQSAGLQMAPEIAALVRLAQAKRCSDKQQAVREVHALGAPSALKALKALASQPRIGCGADGQSDCLECLRSDLRRAIRELSEMR